MSAAAKLCLGFAVALLLHLVGSALIPNFPRLVDVFLVVVALHALGGQSAASLLVGLAVGLVHDRMFSGGLFGLHGFADTLVGYGVARLAQRLVLQRASGVLAVVGLASLLQQLTMVALVLLLVPDPALPRPLWMGVQALVSGTLAMLVYAGAGNFGRYSENRRRNRMSRLRME